MNKRSYKLTHVKINIQGKKIENKPWSGQKMLKFGSYDAVPVSEMKILTDQITQLLGKNMIIETIDMLLYPSKESIDSLIWIPERLIPSLHRDSFLAKVPIPCPVLASGNTTSPYCRAVSGHSLHDFGPLNS